MSQCSRFGFRYQVIERKRFKLEKKTKQRSRTGSSRMEHKRTSAQIDHVSGHDRKSSKENVSKSRKYKHHRRVLRGTQAHECPARPRIDVVPAFRIRTVSKNRLRPRLVFTSETMPERRSPPPPPPPPPLPPPPAIPSKKPTPRVEELNGISRSRSRSQIANPRQKYT